MNHAISQEQINFYQENGYIIIEDFLSADEPMAQRTLA